MLSLFLMSHDIFTMFSNISLILLCAHLLQESNRAHIERTFTSAIIRDKILAPHQAGQLVGFLVDYSELVFTMPAEVEDIVLSRIEMLEKGLVQPRMG